MRVGQRVIGVPRSERKRAPRDVLDARPRRELRFWQGAAEIGAQINGQGQEPLGVSHARRVVPRKILIVNVDHIVGRNGEGDGIGQANSHPGTEGDAISALGTALHHVVAGEAEVNGIRCARGEGHRGEVRIALLRTASNRDEVIADPRGKLACPAVVGDGIEKAEFGLLIPRSGDVDLVALAQRHRGGISVHRFGPHSQRPVGRPHGIVARLHQIAQPDRVLDRGLLGLGYRRSAEDEADQSRPLRYRLDALRRAH